MTLFDANPTILEECQICMHLDHEENILCDGYIVEFYYDPTCNYYERGKYGCRNFHVIKSPLVMLRLSMFYSSPLRMLYISCLDNLFDYKIPSIGSMLDLNVFVTCFMMLSLCFNYYLSYEHQWNLMPS